MKWKRVLITQELLLDILHQHFPGQLPDEMMIWGTRLNKNGQIEIFLFSNEFENLPEGLPAEFLDISFEDFSNM